MTAAVGEQVTLLDCCSNPISFGVRFQLAGAAKRHHNRPLDSIWTR